MALKGTFRNQGKHLFELRIILLGGRNSGKSLVGNAILNQEEFILHERTTCLRRKAEVQGRSVTVVDTPGWWCEFSAQQTPKLVRTEIKHSVSLSLPGPHVFLLVVKTDSVFIEKRRRAVEQHIRLLGETVWSHTLVLFTKGKNKGNKSFENHVQASGEPLQWLLKKCSHRFHVLDTQETCFSTQVRDLMGKIYKLVAENERRHFEIDTKTLQEIEDRRREVEIKAQQRLMRIHKERSTLKALSSHHQNIRLVLLGAKGSGKSSTGNSILAAERGKSFTAKKRTTQCMKKTSTVMGRQVTAVDTPGWWMNYFTQDSSAFDKEEIVKSVYLCPPGPHAFLLVVRVDRSFTEIYRRAIEEHIELLSKDVWNHSIVLFTFGDWLGETTIEQYIESEGKTLQWLVERCGNRYHVLNNKSFGNTFQITELLEKIEEMTAGNRVSHFETDNSLFKAIERKRQVQEDRAKLRRENVLRRRESLSALKNQVQFPTAVRVILLGAKHSGKTSSASCILRKGEQEADNQKPIRGTLIFNETKVEVLDTPGWMAECPDIAEFTGQLLNNWDSCSAGGICILLLVVNASSSFTPKNLKAFEDLLHGKAWSSTLVLFTNGDWLGDVSVEQYIESEGDALQKLVEKCGNRYQVFNNKIKDDDTQVTELVQKIEEMMIEQMLNSPPNRGNIEHPLVNAELRFGGNEQIGKVEISPLGRSTNIHHGDTDIGREHQMIGITKHAPSTSKSLRNTLTDSFSQTENQALVCRSVRLSDMTSLPRNFHRRLVVVLDTSEWFHPHEPWITVNRTDGSETDSATEQHRNESKAERFYAPSLPHNHRETSYSAQTAKERAFREFVQSESLQNLIDQWGDSNIKELEAFIDSYFEMVWQEALKEPKRSTMTPISCESSGVAENDQAHLASIDRKLSKLDILEGVQKDLWELKQSVKHCSRIFQELKDRNKETHDPSRPSEATASAEREGRGRSDEKCKELSRT